MTSQTVFVLTASSLWLKMFAIAIWQAVCRLRSKRFRRPEDAAYFGKGQGEVGDAPGAIVGQAALNNDIENIPMFLIILLAYVWLGGKPLSSAIHGGVYLLARSLHTVWYLTPQQPHRNRAFGLGVLTTVSLVGHTVVLALGA